MLDGTTSEGTVDVNQRLAPDDLEWDGVWWESLGTFVIDTGTLTVRLTDDANSYVIADAIHIVSAGGGVKAPVESSYDSLASDIQVSATLALIDPTGQPMALGSRSADPWADLFGLPQVSSHLKNMPPARALLPSGSPDGELLLAGSLGRVRSS